MPRRCRARHCTGHRHLIPRTAVLGVLATGLILSSASGSSAKFTARIQGAVPTIQAIKITQSPTFGAYRISQPSSTEWDPFIQVTCPNGLIPKYTEAEFPSWETQWRAWRGWVTGTDSSNYTTYVFASSFSNAGGAYVNVRFQATCIPTLSAPSWEGPYVISQTIKLG